VSAISLPIGKNSCAGAATWPVPNLGFHTWSSCEAEQASHREMQVGPAVLVTLSIGL
jgi:hypothetical protein